MLVNSFLQSSYKSNAFLVWLVTIFGDVVLEVRPWLRGQILWHWPWPRNHGLGLEGPLLGLKSCTDNFYHHPQIHAR